MQVTTGYAPTIVGSSTKTFQYDFISGFVFSYYNWILFAFGLFLILYFLRRALTPKPDPLDFEEMPESNWDRVKGWFNRE